MRKTPTGQPSTAEDVLEELAETYRAAEIDFGISRHGEAQVHLHRQSAAADQSGHRAHPHLLSSSGGGDRQAVVDRIRICKTFRSARTRGGASARHSLRRPATRWWPRTIRRSSCASWRIFPATRRLLRAFAEDRDVHQATAAEVFGIAAGTGERRSAALREGDQFRTDVWHVRIRLGAAVGHRPRRCAEIHGSLFRALSRRAALHGRNAPPSARNRLCGNGVWPQALSYRKFNRAMRLCANTPNAAPSMRPCRARRPTSSSAP